MLIFLLLSSDFIIIVKLEKIKILSKFNNKKVLTDNVMLCIMDIDSSARKEVTGCIQCVRLGDWPTKHSLR